MKIRGRLYLYLALSALLGALARQRVESRLEWRYPALNELVVTENYTQDLGALFLGARRLGADLAYIQFLQYYGLRKKEHDHEEHGHAKRGPGIIDEFVGGVYPLLLEKARRTLRLDPFFNGAILEAAGALAFNQWRPDEALALLEEAIRRDPHYYRYHLYASAILYKNENQDSKLIDTLKEAIKYPDCPPIFQGILGNLLRKYGAYADAAKVYLHMMETSPYDYQRHDARKRLTRLLQEHPEIGPQLGLQLR